MATNSVRPIFLFSLPRSGSTLLQRILAKHSAIDTAAEPWILLPLMNTLQKDGVYTNYDHSAAIEAVSDFYTGIEGDRKAFEEEIREFALRLYNKRASSGSLYFLDKTPRYHLIVDEIIQIFPNARFVFLWRNPLAIISSMLNTWHKDRWYLYFFKVDLYDGLENLIAAYSKYKDIAFSVQYESLLTNSQEICVELCEYLDIPFQSEMIEDFQSVQLSGEMGDPTGVKNYSNISSQPIDKWKKSIKNPLRKRWCKSYLNWIGESRLNTMGYNFDTLIKEINETGFSTRRLGYDVILSIYGELYQFLELRLLQDKLRNLSKSNHIHNHPHL